MCNIVVNKEKIDSSALSAVNLLDKSASLGLHNPITWYHSHSKNLEKPGVYQKK